MSQSRSRKHRNPNDYEVGYRKPPVATRFKLGNPGPRAGRQKKKRTVGQIIEEAMMKRITVEENGRSRTVTAQELIIFNLVRTAARTDLRAVRVLFALQERYQNSSDTTLNPAELEVEDREIIKQYLADLQRQGSTPEAGTDKTGSGSDSRDGDQTLDDDGNNDS